MENKEYHERGIDRRRDVLEIARHNFLNQHQDADILVMKKLKDGW